MPFLYNNNKYKMKGGGSMKRLKVLIILTISVSLIMLAAACGKPEQGAQPGPAVGDDDTAAMVTEPGAASDGSKAVSGRTQDVLALLEKADSVGNYYSEGTLFQNQATSTWKVWYNGKFMKGYDGGNDLTRILDFEKNELIIYRGLEGQKQELTEYELAIPINYKWVSEEIFEYLKPENAEYLQQMDIGEEVLNGTDCVLFDVIVFSGEESKYYISKENGFVIKQEFYSRGGEKVMEFSRTVFETGGVTDADFALPEGLVLQ
jgi:hypothetical protein